ncbi:MAG: hypothetical protein RLZZ546_162, partial [Bacteroidota bacterium]
MKMIGTNKDLELLIESIRAGYSNEPFQTDAEIDAYFKAAILILNNIKEPYWKGIKIGEIKYDDYFNEKMDLTFGNNKQNAINQLFQLWAEKKTTTVEFNLRGLQFIMREHSFEFEKEVLQMIVDLLRP